MTESNVDLSLLEKLKEFSNAPRPDISLQGGGGGGTFDGMEERVKRLEDDMREIKSDLKSLLISSAEIKGKIDSLPSSFEFGQLKGRVDNLPTLAKIGTIVGFATAAIVILNNWSAIKLAVLG